MEHRSAAESVEARLKKVTSLTLPDDTLENAINFQPKTLA